MTVHKCFRVEVTNGSLDDLQTFSSLDASRDDYDTMYTEYLGDETVDALEGGQAPTGEAVLEERGFPWNKRTTLVVYTQSPLLVAAMLRMCDNGGRTITVTPAL